MVKKTLFAVALVLALVSMVAAQDTSHPAASISAQKLAASTPAAPSYCNPCLFYSGDWDTTASNWVAFGNGDEGAGTVNLSNYIPFVVPAGHTWNVKGLFTNNISTLANTWDAAPVPWAITSGVSSGVAGTTVASGSSNAYKYINTGRSYGGFYFEQATRVLFAAVTLPAGKYWLSVVPQCVTGPNCSSVYFYNTDTFNANSYRYTFGRAAANHTYVNSPTLGFNYENVCAEGYPPPSCSWMSAGALGTQH